MTPTTDENQLITERREKLASDPLVAGFRRISIQPAAKHGQDDRQDRADREIPHDSPGPGCGLMWDVAALAADFVSDCQ